MSAIQGVKTARKETLIRAAERENAAEVVELEKKNQEEYLNQKELNLFMIIKDEKEEKEIYEIDLLTEIINCRELLLSIDPEFWETLCYETIVKICKRMDQLNINVRTDVLLSYLLLDLLKYKKTAEIIRTKVGEEIVKNIITNIENLEKDSPFEHPRL
jgi:hypothetical protein